jgi:hypothetical protein
MAKRPDSRKPSTLGGYVRLKDALNADDPNVTTRFDGKLSKILVAPPTPFGKRLRSALYLIDTIHSVGDRRIPRIAIVETNDRRALGNLVYHPGTGEPLCLEISRRNEQAELSLLHEIGHFLEFAAIPGANFGHRDWNSDPFLGRMLDAANASACVSHLRTAVQGMTDPLQIRAFGYYLDPKEIWSRAYAQFIAARSQDPVLMGFLDRRRSPNIPDPIQWKDSDFGPMTAAIESVFAELGWLS